MSLKVREYQQEVDCLLNEKRVLKASLENAEFANKELLGALSSRDGQIEELNKRLSSLEEFEQTQNSSSSAPAPLMSLLSLNKALNEALREKEEELERYKESIEMQKTQETNFSKAEEIQRNSDNKENQSWRHNQTIDKTQKSKKRNSNKNQDELMLCCEGDRNLVGF